MGRDIFSATGQGGGARTLQRIAYRISMEMEVEVEVKVEVEVVEAVTENRLTIYVVGLRAKPQVWGGVFFSVT